VGNITQAADFNFYFDPVAVRDVIASRTTKTLIPLDVTRAVEFGLDFLEEVPGLESRVGELLRKILPPAFRSYRRQLGLESITLNDAVGALAVLDRSLFTFTDMAGQVETQGELTRGMTVFDRRPTPDWSPNMEVATQIDAAATRKAVSQILRMAGQITSC
jgi:purine nucleosidase